jgi:hypothetical protein
MRLSSYCNILTNDHHPDISHEINKKGTEVKMKSHKFFYRLIWSFITISVLCIAVAEAAESGKGMPASWAVSGAKRNVPADFLGYNCNLTRKGSWRDKELLGVLEQLSPGSIRYPAGTIANYWNWRTGWFKMKNGKSIFKKFGRVKKNPNTLEDLKIAVDKTGAEAIFVVNMLTSDLEEQLKMLRTAKAMGIPFSKVELGNEFYLNSKAYVKVFPTAQSYAKVCNQWCKAIKKEFPNVKIGIVGAAIRATDKGRRRTWNTELYKELKSGDAIIFHVYQGLGFKRQKQLEGTGLVAPGKGKKRRKGVWGDEAEQKIQLARLNAKNGVQNVLKSALTRAGFFKEPETMPKGYESWVTEWSVFDRVGPGRGTWANGLFVAIMVAHFLDNPKVTATVYHSFAGNPMFCLYLSSENVYKRSIRGRPCTPYSLSGSGYAMALFAKALKGAANVQKITFKNIKDQIRAKKGRRYPAVFAYQFADKVGKGKLLVFNLTSKGRKIDTGNFAGIAFKQVFGDPRRLVCGPGDITVKTGTTAKKLQLPPYSMTLVAGL